MSNAPDSGGSGRTHTWTVGDRLRAAREHCADHPSQAEFAKLLGFSRNTVARYERDAPGADKPIVIMRWAQVTGFSESWLLTGEDGRLGEGLTRKLGISECYPRPAVAHLLELIESTCTTITRAA